MRRVGREYRRRRKPELLFDLMRSLDEHVHPQRPLDSCVWVALLAAPLVAKECASLVAKQEVRGICLQECVRCGGVACRHMCAESGTELCRRWGLD